MNTVIFLGAGATKAQWDAEDKTVLRHRAQCRLPHRSLLAPPLDGTFLKEAALRQSNNYPYVRAFADVHIPGCRGNQLSRRGMEWLFVKVFNRAMKGERQTESRIVLHHLLVMYRKQIAVSTCPLFPPTSATTPLTELIRMLSRESDDLTTITTNQDLGAENAVDFLRSHRDILSRRTCPLSRIYSLTLRHRYTTLSEWHTDCFSKVAWPAIPILKLHGSLNWWYQSRSDFDPADIRSVKSIIVFTHKEIPHMEVLRVRTRHPMRLYPVVVPPVREKKSNFLRGILDPVWREARRKLKDCDRLVVFGYSFPGADREACDLFAKHLSKRIREIVVINTRRAAKGSLAKLIANRRKDACKIKYFPSVARYLEARCRVPGTHNLIIRA